VSGHETRIAALVLAAGQSRRMGGVNKLLAEVDGRPMVARVVETALASRAAPVVVVTGHERAAVEGALVDTAEGAKVVLVHNPEHRAGLSTSLRRGLAALPEETEGVVVCLADMPRVPATAIDRLIDSFAPEQAHAICLPTWGGKRGNPVLLARRFFSEMQAVTGDVGARAVVAAHPEAVYEVAMDDLPDGRAVLLDVDTPEALAGLKPAG
jgi:molybdenum cofactor cytidylyltransferase